jgi:signal recognition particle subunit SRP54
MVELEEIKAAVEPANTLLVCDALMGRDAVNVAQTFSDRIDVDGVVLTKLDGDARGGAALGLKAVTGVPIKFIGTGESVDRLEEFRPEGLASRILGMGDIVGLVKDFEAVVDEKQAEEDAERMLKGQVTLDDLLTQLKTIQKMGPLKDVFGKMPMFGGMADQVEDSELRKVEALISSMTRQERQKPDLIDKSRAERIAKGSGRKAKEVTDLLGRFRQMRELMGQMGKPGGLLSRLGGGLPGLGGGPAGAMPGLPGGMAGGAGMDPAALMGGLPGMGGGKSGKMKSSKAKTKNKNKRRQARKSRQKGRKR